MDAKAASVRRFNSSPAEIRPWGVTQEPVVTPERDEGRQRLGLVRQWDLSVTMSCNKRGEELSVAYDSNHIPRAPGGMDRTVNLVVELLEIYGETHFIGSLFSARRRSSGTSQMVRRLVLLCPP